ncbi:MAG TPA: hypothetical protein VF952_21005 [Chloroflexia bacterium]
MAAVDANAAVAGAVVDASHSRRIGPRVRGHDQAEHANGIIREGSRTPSHTWGGADK